MLDGGAFRVKQPYRRISSKAKNGELVHTGRRGPLATPFEAVAFLKTSVELDHPDIQLHFIAMGVGDPMGNSSPYLPYPSVTVYVNANYPESRGSIRLSSSDATQPSRRQHRVEHWHGSRRYN
jgi:choline dehydrogenase-like flavoprotein